VIVIHFDSTTYSNPHKTEIGATSNSTSELNKLVHDLRTTSLSKIKHQLRPRDLIIVNIRWNSLIDLRNELGCWGRGYLGTRE
jgi:hypothetical protein